MCKFKCQTMAKTIQNRVNNILRKVFTSDVFSVKGKKKEKIITGIQKQVDWSRTSHYVWSLKMVYKLQTFKILLDRWLVEKQNQWNLKRILLHYHEHSSRDVIDPLFNISSHILKFTFIWMFDYWISWSLFNNKQ